MPGGVLCRGGAPVCGGRCARREELDRWGPAVLRHGRELYWGTTLVLCSDGLIERRDEDIDTGLARLADSLVHHGQAGHEALADALLTGRSACHPLSGRRGHFPLGSGAGG
ncbi:SpoIIE family protein phosphatase [Streptomyces sp. NBC_00080]|uniref:SpoIIE family protein phosphatase n=1 Tax=Streptomyces sp. NBC_00080 TaxID=2975645 RepID=UPI002F90EF90